MTLEMLADNRIEFIREFITEDKGQFPISIQNHVDDKQKESLSLQEGGLSEAIQSKHHQ